MFQRRRPAAALPASTDALIASLSADLRPVKAPSGAESLRDALLGGGVVATALFFAGLGTRPDLIAATASGPFWIKLAYASALAALAWRALDGLGSPDRRPISLLPLLAPVVALAALILTEGLGSGSASDQAYWLGSSWSHCSLYVAALSAPMTAGLLWAFRELAPTQVRAAGFLAGLVSGAIAATIYSLGCGETSLGFVGLWYSLGMLLPAMFGAIVARRLLRW